MLDNSNNPLFFLLDTAFELYIVVLLLRYILQIVRADFYNPLAQFIWQVTNAPVGLIQRAIPRWRQHDFGSLLFAYLLAVINIRLDLAISGFGIELPSLLWLAALKMITLTCNLYFFSILVQVIMSWVGPGSPTPAAVFLWNINEPLLRPVRNVLPPIGGLDLSPMVVVIALQAFERLLRQLPGLLS